MAETKVVRHTFHNFVNILSSSLLSVGVTAVVARMLAPDRMGTYSLLQWIVSLAALAAAWGYTTTAMKFVAEHLGRGQEAGVEGVLATASRQVVLGGAMAAVALATFGLPMAHLMRNPEVALDMALAASGVVPAGLLALWMAAHQGLQRYGTVALITGITAPFTLTATILALVLGTGIPGLMAVGSGTAWLGCLAYGIALTRSRPGWWRQHLDRPGRQRLWAYTMPVFGLQLLDAIVWQRSEVFFLGTFSVARQIAFYSLAFGLATMAMRLIPGTLIGLLIPSMARLHGAGDPEGVRRVFRKSCHFMAVLALPVALGGTLLAGPLVHLLYGAAYAPVAPLLVAMLWASAAVMIWGFPASSALYATDGERILVKIGLAVAVVNLALDLLLIPRWGAAGATAANSLAQVSSIVPGLWAANRVAGTGRPPGGLLRIGLAAAWMALPVYALTRLLPSVAALLLGIPLGAAVYAVALLKCGAIAQEDMEPINAVLSRLPTGRMPGFARLAAISRPSATQGGTQGGDPSSP